MRFTLLSLAVLAAFAGCADREGILLTVSSADPTLAPTGLDVEFSVGGKPAQATLSEKGGQPITFPTTAFFIVQGASGMYTVVVTATGATGAPIATGMTQGSITAGETAHANVSLTSGVVNNDGGSDGPVIIPDGGPSDGPGPAVLSISRTPKYDFGSVLVGATSAPVAFSVTNSGDSTSGTLDAAAIGGSDAAEFEIVSDGCQGQPLAPGAICSVQVHFKPTAAGTPLATLSITAAPGGTASTMLTGTALTPGALSFTPAPAMFGMQIYGATNDQTLMLMNTGGVASGSITLTLGGSDSGQFMIRPGDTCSGQMLQAGASCSVTVRFTSAAPSGPKTASIQADATPGGPGVAGLQATALAPAGLAILAAPDTFDFGTVNTGSSLVHKFTVTNQGDQTSGTLGAPVLGGAGFAVDGATTTCAVGMTLAGGASCFIGVKFTPAAAGSASSTLSVTASPGGTPSVNLTGLGQSTVTLTVVPAGNGAGTVTNTAGGTGAINCGGTCMQSFTYTTTTPTVTLQAGASTGSSFTSWSANCTPVNGSNPPQCTITLSANASVTATFTLQQFTVAVVKEVVSGVTAGSVTTSDSKINCGATCSATYNYSTTNITFQATPSGGNRFLGWAGDCKGTANSCTVAPTQARTVIATFGPSQVNYMFVSSVGLAPPFGNTPTTALTNADAFCAARATAAAVPGTTWRAFLASGANSAFSRLGAANGWVRTDGRPFANTAASMNFNAGKGNTFYPPRIDENGNDFGANEAIHVATGQFPLSVATDRCLDWTSSAGTDNGWSGTPSWGGTGWMSYTDVSCNQIARVYCFAVDVTATITPPAFNAATGRAIWVSTAQYTPKAGGTIDDADSVCRTEAQTASLATPYTNYQALIAPGTVSALSRFDVTAGALPWTRLDGTVVALSTNLANFPLRAPISTSYDGNVNASVSAWTGSTAGPGSGTNTTNCNNWSSSTVTGVQGDSRPTGADFWNGSGGFQNCSVALQVFCAHK